MDVQITDVGWSVADAAGKVHHFFTADAAEDFIFGPLIDPDN